jgi:hypothetical protein
VAELPTCLRCSWLATGLPGLPGSLVSCREPGVHSSGLPLNNPPSPPQGLHLPMAEPLYPIFDPVFGEAKARAVPLRQAPAVFEYIRSEGIKYDAAQPTSGVSDLNSMWLTLPTHFCYGRLVCSRNRCRALAALRCFMLTCRLHHQGKVDGGAHDVGPHVSQVLAELNLGTAPRQAALAERPSGARV